MRYLYRVDNGEPFAYERSHRNFFLVSDDTLWAHESHQWLLAADTSVGIARRIGLTYYDAETGAPLYYAGAEPASGDDSAADPPAEQQPRAAAKHARHR